MCMAGREAHVLLHTFAARFVRGEILKCPLCVLRVSSSGVFGYFLSRRLLFHITHSASRLHDFHNQKRGWAAMWVAAQISLISDTFAWIFPLYFYESSLCSSLLSISASSLSNFVFVIKRTRIWERCIVDAMRVARKPDAPLTQNTPLYFHT